MARLLVQLKLRLLRNALYASTAAKVSFVLSTIFAGLVAIGTFAILALLRGQATSMDVTAVIFTAFAFGWLIVPIFAFGLDGTLDPATLALYPLRIRPLVTGLLAASFAGAWPLANVIGLLGVTVGLARGPSGVIVAVVAVVLQVLFCITLARLVTTSMAGLLRSRRGKDLAAFLIIPIFALYEFFTQVVPTEAAKGRVTTASFRPLDAWLRWLPPGLAAHAIQDASDGDPALAVARLALMVAVIAAAGWLWVRSLSRALVTTDTTSQSAQVRGAVLPLARFGLRGAVAARFWIYQRRDPASLVYWAMTAVIMGAVSARAILGPQGHPAFILGSAVVGAGFVGCFHANSAGLTGPAFVVEATSLSGRRALRSYFAGQDLALAVIAVPLVTAVSFGLAALARQPGFGFLGTAVGLAGLGAALALANIFSVVLPYPMDRRAGNPMRQPAQGYTGYQFLGILGCVGGTALAVSPLIIATDLTSTDPAGVRMPLLLICAAAYGVALAMAGTRIAAYAAQDRLPELSQIAIRSRL